MPLDIDNMLPTINTRLGTYDKNEATFFTRVDYFAVMNVENLKLHQFIKTANQDILEIYIQFHYENHFDSICLNCAHDKKKKN